MDDREARVSVPYAFRFSDAVNGEWLPVSAAHFDYSSIRRTDPPEELHLITWTIDDTMPFHAQRIVGAIEALRDHLASCCEELPTSPQAHRDSTQTVPQIRTFAPPSLMPTPTHHKRSELPAIHAHDNRCPATVIYLQGLTADLLPIVLAHLWVCHNFIVSDVSGEGLGECFTLALLDRRLAHHARCFVRAASLQSDPVPDLLLVEIAMHGKQRMRLANTSGKTLKRRIQIPSQSRLSFMQQLVFVRKQLDFADGGVYAGTFRLFSQPLAAAAVVAEVGLHDLWEPDRTATSTGDRMQHTWGHWPRDCGTTDFAPQRASKFCTTGAARISRGRVARLALDARCEIHIPGTSSFALNLSEHCAIEVYVSLAQKPRGILKAVKFLDRK